MRRPWLIGAVLFLGVAGAVVFFASRDDEPAGPPHFSIFDRPAGARDRAPQAEPASALRTEEQAGELRLVGSFRGYRMYLGRTGRGMCVFQHLVADGSTATGCSPRTRAFAGGTTMEKGVNVAFVAVPDGYTEAEVVEGEVVEDRLMTNGYAAAFRGGLVTVRFEGSRGERDVELHGWP